MNRQEFTNRLAARLKRLPQEEYEEAMSYYEQYFEDADNDDEVIASLGGPDAVANKILADFVTDETKPKSWGAVWIVILAIFASPIALPVAIALMVSLIAIAVGVFAVVAAFAVSGAAVVVSGIVGAALSFAFIGVSPASTIFFVGLGLVGAALGTQIIILARWLALKSRSALSRIYGLVLRRSAS